MARWDFKTSDNFFFFFKWSYILQGKKIGFIQLVYFGQNTNVWWRIFLISFVLYDFILHRNISAGGLTERANAVIKVTLVATAMAIVPQCQSFHLLMSCKKGIPCLKKKLDLKQRQRPTKILWIQWRRKQRGARNKKPQMGIHAIFPHPLLSNPWRRERLGKFWRRR